MDSIKTQFPDTLFSETSFNVKESHRLKSISKQKEQLALKQKLSDYKVRPNLSLGIKYSIINEKIGITENKDAFGISLGFSLPLWRGKYSSEEESYLNEASSLNQKMLYVQKSIEEAISFLLIDIKEKKRSLTLYANDLIPKAELTLQASISAYETGKLNFLSLLDAKRMLLNFQLMEIDIRKMYHTSISAYKKETTILRDGE